MKIIEMLHFLYKQCLSRWLAPACRFYPSCSDYFLQSCREQGVPRGVYSGLLRLTRCHPFSEGGWDPVSPMGKRKAE